MIQRSIARLTLACGLLAWAFAANLAHADACPAHYVDGRKTEITNPKPDVATQELCYKVFGVMHSG
ncbi:MAG: DNA/RNA non-specific endonuclease, partial [Janthinobacterium lividum]|nr:DNA/RNA non-specific endonuclease [Janthinobacterium lividum]